MEFSYYYLLYFVVLVAKQRLEGGGLAAFVVSADIGFQPLRLKLVSASVFVVAVPRAQPLDCSAECLQLYRNDVTEPKSV